MRRFLAALAIACALPAAALAQGEQQKKIDAVFAAYDRQDSPGCAVGVIRDGQLVVARGYGMANLEHGVPITGSTLFDIGSTSKQFTAAAILLLAQDGKLSLDDDIRKHIPEIPAYPQTVTIRQLLHHTSGLRDYLTLWSLAGVDFDGITNEDDALRLIARQKELNFAPGEEHLYSNSGYFLMSVIVRRASGKSLREFAAERIFGPLGMEHTHFHDDHTMIMPRRATGYAPVRNGGFRVDMSGFEQTGDGSVYTTVEDLLLWDRNFYEPKVGGPALIHELLVTGMLNDGRPLTYARGLAVDKYKGLKIVSHGGSWAGYRADLIRFPEEKLSVACLCNVANANPSRLARQVAEIYLGDRMTTPASSTAAADAASANAAPAPPTEADLKEKPGTYLSRSSGRLMRITAREGKLWISMFGAPPEELGALGGGRFRVASWPPSYEIAYEAGSGGSPAQIRFSRENARPDVFEFVEAFAPTAQQLAEFAGSYYSDELDVTYVVAVEANGLVLGVKDRPRRPVQPAYRDAFTGPGGAQFEFTRDPQGKLTGFLVHAGRIRNVRFARQ